ncbi:alpha/beta hydrolase [Mumia sp. ZJ1417]|uniref:alpha/beta fold hydrolase n=1 Tax=Mumia sp. ZJ1417 TaxID=2708082 RepID=UPI00141EB5E0|nr:alpha/beta hydrolase [Mumia sp. ZJ1417]QMW65863.1 alpha/beta hydrolase [Mumia sp. ZJ1417]
MSAPPTTRTRVMSADGTAIGVTRRGSGPPVVLVDGALTSSRTDPGRPLAAALATRFTVYDYDRRGRGTSGDTPPYTPAREVDDLTAVIAHAGPGACLFGMSSGAALALEAVAAGLPVRRLAVYEPPYTGEVTGPADVRRMRNELEAILADDARGSARYGDAVARLMATTGMPQEMVTLVRHTPVWREYEALAPTLAYDLALLDDGIVPRRRFEHVDVPTLVLDGAASPELLRRPSRIVACLVSAAAYQSLPDQTHDVDPTVLAPILADFFA